MISLQLEADVAKFIEGKVECRDVTHALAILHKHLSPLRESSNHPDNRIYLDLLPSFEYFATEYRLGNLFDPTVEEITNWHFLNLLSCVWTRFVVAASRRFPGRDIAERRSIERGGVRALAKYDVIVTTLFRDQSHYSIFGADLNLLRLSLREVLIGEGRI